MNSNKQVQVVIVLFCYVASLEEERKRIEQLTAGWDDPTQVSWGESDVETSGTTETSEAPAAPLYKCTALYSYTVSGF